MCLASNDWNYNLIDFIGIRSEDLVQEEQYLQITCSLVIIKYDDKFALVRHKERQQWELPGGSKEEGETPRECAVRELFEETNQIVNDVDFKGLGKLYNDKGKDEYVALYFGEIEQLRDFNNNKEIEDLIFWNLEDDIGKFDEINKYLLNIYIGDMI